MMDYGFSEGDVELTLNCPDSIVDGHSGRKIYQRKLNGHILRVVVEIEAEIKRVITVYSSDGARYEV
jgi:hypothetical protein